MLSQRKVAEFVKVFPDHQGSSLNPITDIVAIDLKHGSTKGKILDGFKY